MKKYITFIAAFLMALTSAYGQGNLSAAKVLEKTAGIITNSKGVEAKFTIYNSGYSGSGVIKTSGQKFNVTLPDVEVWYNGKDLYTYSKRTGETTVINPGREELMQTNPLAYVSGAASTYNISYSTVKKQGKNVLELTPKVKGGEIKRITLTLNKSNDFPEKIVVEPTGGQPITAEITSFKTGGSGNSEDFEYPVAKYPKVEIIDLR